jgi:hypothetical protein
MQEISKVKQDADNKGKKRWFRGDTFDIFTWQDSAGRFTGLHLCYDRDSDEHILRWGPAVGYWHERVDADETKPGRAMSAILRANGVFPGDVVLRQFLAAAPQLPPDVAAFIEERIRLCPATPRPPGTPARAAV